jgi:hypothetical protein
MSAANRPASGHYTVENVSGDPQNWGELAPRKVYNAVNDLMLGKPKQYRIYFDASGTNGALSHMVAFAANNSFVIAPGDLQTLLDAGLSIIRVLDGNIVLYFTLPETSNALKRMLRDAGY